jgi:hypothetical protein
MKFLNKLKLMPFLVGLFVGFFFIYILKPSAVVVVRYPNMDNVGKIIYRDRNGTCFQYGMQTVSCDKSEDRIKAYPLQ